MVVLTTLLNIFTGVVTNYAELQTTPNLKLSFVLLFIKVGDFLQCLFVQDPYFAAGQPDKSVLLEF